jgi:hypothetical protein
MTWLSILIILLYFISSQGFIKTDVICMRWKLQKILLNTILNLFILIQVSWHVSNIHEHSSVTRIAPQFKIVLEHVCILASCMWNLGCMRKKFPVRFRHIVSSEKLFRMIQYERCHENFSFFRKIVENFGKSILSLYGHPIFLYGYPNL